mmetsp:Transcript_31047/g.75976  ORF Transcript_31047/g.75976 Transcript_31047/m.75976 type:complete len:221 (-) Transcript_31047:606-1268(-)
MERPAVTLRELARRCCSSCCFSEHRLHSHTSRPLSTMRATTMPVLHSWQILGRSTTPPPPTRTAGASFTRSYVVSNTMMVRSHDALHTDAPLVMTAPVSAVTAFVCTSGMRCTCSNVSMSNSASEPSRVPAHTWRGMGSSESTLVGCTMRCTAVPSLSHTTMVQSDEHDHTRSPTDTMRCTNLVCCLMMRSRFWFSTLYTTITLSVPTHTRCLCSHRHSM